MNTQKIEKIYSKLTPEQIQKCCIFALEQFALTPTSSYYDGTYRENPFEYQSESIEKILPKIPTTDAAFQKLVAQESVVSK